MQMKCYSYLRAPGDNEVALLSQLARRIQGDRHPVDCRQAVAARGEGGRGPPRGYAIAGPVGIGIVGVGPALPARWL